MPQKALDPDLATVIHRITDRFIMSREGTPVHVAKAELDSKHGLLDEAERNRYVQRIGPNYFPSFRALELEPSRDRSNLERCTSLVFNALKSIYKQGGDVMCSQNNILQAAKSMDPGATPECVVTGMLFASEFPMLVPVWNASPDNNALNLSLQTSSRLLEFKDLVSAWKLELKNRSTSGTTAPAAEPKHTTAKRVIFETTGETYTPQGLIRQGGTAMVFNVTDSEGKPWALKCLKPELATSTRTKRFLNELEFCRRSSHPNVVRVMDQGFITQGGKKCPFYVMPYYSQTLRDLIKKGIPRERVLPLFSLMLDGVEAAHLNRVWHRDLKPENILCEEGAQALVVADFGIAHFAEEELYTLVETSGHERLANFQYAAPEQRRRGSSVDHRADIYALGLILNEMFTGTVPEGTEHQLIARVAPEFAFLDEIVARMRRQEPEARPGSISDVKALIQRFKAEAVSLQRLSKIDGTVIKATDVDEALAETPPKLIDFDWGHETLTLVLDRAVTPEWINALRQMSSFSSVLGKPPQVFRFEGNKAYVMASEHEIQLIIENFKTWLPTATRTLKTILQEKANKEAAARAHQLRIEREAEQQRLRILRNLKI